MEDDKRLGRDEMNLAVLPVTKLGKTDKREVIEYQGTFNDGEGQKEMVWTVRGAAGLGLPGELGERILVALLYIGSQKNFADRRMEFSVYQVLKILGLTDGSNNYRNIERAIAQLHGLTITSDKAWVSKGKDGKLQRTQMTKGFHVIDDYTLWHQEEAVEDHKSYILWGERIWKSIQSGYIKQLDIEFYYQIENPLARRLYRFLDKMTYYRPSRPYVIDIFALANKLGMVAYEFPTHLKRPLSKAADELVANGYLASYDFFKLGKFHRIRFYRANSNAPIQLTLENCDLRLGSEIEDDPDPWLDMIAEMTDNIARNLGDTQLLSIEDGVATVQASKGSDWLNTQLAQSVVRELKLSGYEIEKVIFVE